MDAIEKEGLKGIIRLECEYNASAYSMKRYGYALLPTSDSCFMIAQWIFYEWNNFDPVYDETKTTLEEAKGNFSEYANVCIAAFYKYLELSDGEYQEIGDSKGFLFNEVKRLLKRNYNLS